MHHCRWDNFSATLVTVLSIRHLPGANDSQLQMIVYLPVAIISQALSFFTCFHGSFIERLSIALFLSFCISQFISSIIAAYGKWRFAHIQTIRTCVLGSFQCG